MKASGGKTNTIIRDVMYMMDQPLRASQSVFGQNKIFCSYKVEKEIPICSVYGCCIKNKQGVYVLTGEQRTGCSLYAVLDAT